MKIFSFYIRIKQLLQIGGFLLIFPLSGISQSTPPDTAIQELIVDSSSINLDDQLPEAPVILDDTGDYHEETTKTITRLPDSIIFRSVPDTTLSKLKSQKEFEYANDPEYWIKKKKKEKSNKGIGYFIEWVFGSSAVRIIMYILIGLIILYTLYRIIENNNLFYNSSKRTISGISEDAVEMEDENLDEKIRKAIADKDHRKAVRYLYFKTLRTLDQRGWIRYHAQATNYDYITQVSSYPVAEDFKFLTQVYEYVWYGDFKLTDEQFGIVHTNFQKIIK